MVPLVRLSCQGLLALCLAVCATKVYYPDGNLQAEIPWHQSVTFDAGNTHVSSCPAPGAIDAATTVAIHAVNLSPAVIGKVADVVASRATPKN